MCKYKINFNNTLTVWFNKMRKEVSIIYKVKKTVVLLLNTALNCN